MICFVSIDDDAHDEKKNSSRNQKHRGIKLGGVAQKTTPLSSPVAPPPPVAATTAGLTRPASGGSGKAKRARPSSATRSAKPSFPAPVAPAPPLVAPAAPAPPLVAPAAPAPAPEGNFEDIPWADEEDGGGAGAATTATTTTATPLLSPVAAPPPASAGAAAAAAKATKATPRGRPRSKSASPSPSSSASAKKKKKKEVVTKAKAEEEEVKKDATTPPAAEEDAQQPQDVDQLPLPTLHPTRSTTREPVIRISDCRADPSIPDAPFPRNNPMAVVSLVEKIAKRDKEGVFRDVPTDYVAPNYSKLIKRPLAFSTIRARAANSGYGGWDELCSDLDTMLDNCRAYNGPDSPWGVYADAVQLAAARMLQLTRAGVTDLRGKTGNLFSLQQYQQQQQQREQKEREMREARELEGDEGAFATSAGNVHRYLRDASAAGGIGGFSTTGGTGAGAPIPHSSSASLFSKTARGLGFGAGGGASVRVGGGLLRSLRADAEAGRDGLPRRMDDHGNALEWRFQNKRASYPARIAGLGAGTTAAAAAAAAAGRSASDAVVAVASAAGGLARGHNADGHALLGVLALLPSYVGAPPSDAYARSVARFASGLKGRARERALRAAAASLPPARGKKGGRRSSVSQSPVVPGPAAAAALPQPVA